jgi:hypothetical protein
MMNRTSEATRSTFRASSIGKTISNATDRR